MSIYFFYSYQIIYYANPHDYDLMTKDGAVSVDSDTQQR